MSHAAGAVLVCAVEGTTLTSAERDFYEKTSPAGVTLFPRNIVQDDHSTVAKLIRDLQSTRLAGAPPLVIAIDQEGGRVARIKGAGFDPGPAQKMAGGRVDDAALAELRQIAETMGRKLWELGFNVDFAPVLDVLTEPTNVGIGDRVFGTDAATVAVRAEAFLVGLEKTMVMGCLKHFPGQGAAKVDTHLGAAVVDITKQVLRERELVPFVRLMKRAPMVMVAHCIYPAVAKEEASRSRAVVTGLLREELGFGGVVVSDDMNMGALPQEVEMWQGAIVDSVAAGVDMLLVCRHLERYWKAHEALVREAAKSKAFAVRLEDAARRVTGMRAGIGVKSSRMA